MHPAFIAALTALSLAACGGPSPSANQVAPTPTPSASSGSTALETPYLGRWTGVEGMYLNVTKRDGGGLNLDMKWNLDNAGIFPGTATATRIRFDRRGESLTLSPGDGAATGLKYLAGKKDCLTVRPSEGYCRD